MGRAQCGRPGFADAKLTIYNVIRHMPEGKYMAIMHLRLALLCRMNLTRNDIVRFMRVVLAAALALLAAAPVQARPGDKLQNRPYADMRRWHLGFSVGAHVQDLSFTHNGFIAPDGARWSAEVPAFDPGFCVNVMGEARLNRLLSLRLSPGMYFGSKNVRMQEFATGAYKNQDVKSAYVVVPLDLKISGDRMRNMRPYVTTGVMATFDVSKKRSEALMFNTADAYLTVGLGIDFYLPYFKLDPEIKFCFGLTDILRHDRPDLTDDPETMLMTQSLKKVKSNMVVLTFYFE